MEMLRQNGIMAFSQEASANVAMHGAPGFGIYGMDIFVKTDDAENAVELIKEIRNQEKQQKIGILDKKNWIQMTKGEWLKLFSFFAVRQKEVCMMSYTFLQTSLNDRN